MVKVSFPDLIFPLFEKKPGNEATYVTEHILIVNIFSEVAVIWYGDVCPSQEEAIHTSAAKTEL